MSEQSVVFVASLGEWGFFTSEPATTTTPISPGSLPANVRQDFETVYVEGLVSPLPFFSVSLASVPEGELTHHLVVSAYPPFPPDAILDATGRVLRASSSATLCFIVEDQTGWARATSVTGGSPPSVAAAVAHTKIVGGWDESDPIVVTVDGAAFQISPHVDGSRWKLAVARAW